MSDTLTPAARAVRALNNAELAYRLDVHKAPALPHPDGPHLKPLRPTMTELRKEAARRLRWADVYASHVPEGDR